MEIVLAFGLLAVAILALIAMFTSGVKLSAQARNITVAFVASDGITWLIERDRSNMCRHDHGTTLERMKSVKVH